MTSPSAATTAPPVTGKRRLETDVIKLINQNHEVHMLNSVNEFVVKFHGPKDSVYENGVWKVRVELPDKYPFKSPSIGFLNKIFHPNIDEASGTVCLDVINQAWTALYELTNIFECFLPQLLCYPNASDPLNGEAARMYMHKPDDYKKTVRDYVLRYATEKKPVVPEGAQPIIAIPTKSLAITAAQAVEELDDDDVSCSSLSEFDEKECRDYDFDEDEDEDTRTVDRMDLVVRMA
uniref:UBIQUITIN_CONJUGAT_2 domain-containing protein n=1 Tax=Caenorhabditis tropicalis TaxID=1561998 RepID=A0A1I7USR3_9PELO